jgi:serine phosphatase RsbU (regulator of sigma subunit)
LILNELNYKLKHFLPTSMFMGCLLLAYSPREMLLRVFNGGMPSAILKSSTGATTCFESADLPLGIIEKQEQDFCLQEVRMNSGDSLVVYSDGLIEAENPRGEQFGQDRLLSVIEASSRGKLEEDILAAWQGFQAEGRQLDDVTLVTVNF